MKKEPTQPSPVAPPPSKKTSSKRPHPRGVRLAIQLIAVFAVALLGGALGTYLVGGGNSTMTSFERSSRDDGNVLRSQTEQDLSQVASEVAPNVVSIATDVKSPRGQIVGQGAGTGVIVSRDGYVMTNNHVIDGASSVSITTSGGDIYDDVEVIGSDPLNDIAFLKISGVDDLDAAELGNSNTLKIGQNVFAIGNSLGEYKNTLTTGIVSGLNRPVTAASGDGSDAESLTGLIQTDAAINPGNSGGPLVNSAGQVIGINTAVASDAQGIGFAIPINATKGVLAGVIENNKVERAYIGVRYVDITPAIAKERDLSVKEGALVLGDDSSSAVVNGGPADKAGIKSEDIITAIGDMKVGESGSITSIIGMYQPGETIKVTYLRDGKERTTNLTLAKYDAPAETTSATEQEQQEESPRANGESYFDPYSLFGF